MLKRTLALSLLAAALSFQTGFSAAADAVPSPAAQERQPIFGSELMTDAERLEYRSRMRAAATAEEREALRIEHHERMKARAAERGVVLPDVPPAAGMRGAASPGTGAAVPRGRNLPAFSDFDADGDGRLSREELGAGRSARISERASEGRMMRGLAGAESFEDMDANGDGAVSAEEFSTHRQRMMSGANAGEVRRGGGMGRGMPGGMGGMGPGGGMRQGGGR